MRQYKLTRTVRRELRRLGFTLPKSAIGVRVNFVLPKNCNRAEKLAAHYFAYGSPTWKPSKPFKLGDVILHRGKKAKVAAKA